MTKQEKPKSIRNRYSPKYKTEALALSEKLGVPIALKRGNGGACKHAKQLLFFSL